MNVVYVKFHDLSALGMASFFRVSVTLSNELYRLLPRLIAAIIVRQQHNALVVREHEKYFLFRERRSLREKAEKQEQAHIYFKPKNSNSFTNLLFHSLVRNIQLISNLLMG